MPFLLFVMAFIPMLVFIVGTICTAIVKLAGGARLRKDLTYQPNVSVLLPCFNEGQIVYDTIASISQSDYPRDKFEVIAVDDCSVDDSYEWMLQAQQDFPRVTVLRNEKNSGKAITTCNAAKLAKAEILICIDSDCIFAPNTIQELVACFVDPRVGGVGGRVGIRNVNDSIVTQAQTFIYYLRFQLQKVFESWTRTVACISGCLFAIRRELMEQIEPKVLQRHWFGIPFFAGEDRFITHQILLEGYGTIINNDAQCWTKVPVTLSQLIKQQNRWRKSGMRDFTMTLRMIPQHVCTLHPMAIYAIIIPPLATVTGAIVIADAPLTGLLFWMNPILLCVMALTGIVTNWFIRKTNPEQEMKYPLLMGGFAAWMFPSFFITILALLTFDFNDWGTRAKHAPPPESGAQGDEMPTGYEVSTAA